MTYDDVLQGEMMTENCKLEIRYLCEQDKKEICSWKYDEEYKIYNLPSYEEMKEKALGFTNPKREKNYRGFYDSKELVGFTNILEEEHEVFIGIGVNPKLCNRGYGQLILIESYKLSKQLYPNKPLYLEVRTWNKRAINCYKKAGFKIDGDSFEMNTGIGSGTFYKMTKE